MDVVLFILGFLFNLAVSLIIVRFIYYPNSKDRSNIFTFIAFNTVIFFVISILTSVELSIGVGFGLFALFSILRYRTDEIPIRDMTYLFIILALPVMNSVMFGAELYSNLFVANFCIVAMTFLLEKGFGFRYESKKKIKYEKIDMIKPENHNALILDLENRTGIKNILRFEVGSIDFLRDMAEITVYYREEHENGKRKK